MKKLVCCTALSLLLLLGMVGQPSAYITEIVHLDFASGAVWDGTITFNDLYQGMIDTDGYLNGGIYTFDNEHFSCTWLEAIGQGDLYDSNNDGLYNDWLSNGPPGASSIWIGLSWDDQASISSGSLCLVMLDALSYSGNSAYSDPLTGWSVPEPATMLLLGSGLLGLAALSRKKFKKA